MYKRYRTTGCEVVYSVLREDLGTEINECEKVQVDKRAAALLWLKME